MTVTAMRSQGKYLGVSEGTSLESPAGTRRGSGGGVGAGGRGCTSHVASRRVIATAMRSYAKCVLLFGEGRMCVCGGGGGGRRPEEGGLMEVRRRRQTQP